MKYRPEIDGLRAFSIIAVILFHVGFKVFCGGFVGVDIFFVISGYLITTILLNDLQAGRFSLVHFYERRARRILPVLFFVMLVCIPCAWILLPPSELLNFSKSLVAVSTFTSNFFFSRNMDYFATAADLKPLLHTWSLAVEEQYYILFPIFLLFFWRFGKRFVFGTIVGFSFISLIAAQIASSLAPVPNFFYLPTRAWELGVGAMCALFWVRKGMIGIDLRYKQIFAFFGFLFILLSILCLGAETPFPSVYTLFPVLGAALIILFAQEDTFVGKVLSFPLFVGIGLISYSLYLWHQPIFSFARFVFPSSSLALKLLLVAITFFISILSWKYVEQPFRKNTVFSRKFIFSGGIIVSCLFIVFGIVCSKLKFNIEATRAAKELASSVAIYASNMNEREFIKARVDYEVVNPHVIVLGSSRIMQIGTQNTGYPVLNLGVSGASLEDDIAICGLALKKFNPDVILISADPWLFNIQSGQNRWRSLESDYYSAMTDLGIGGSLTKPLEKVSSINQSINQSIFLKKYIKK